jgi:hypothetical protein
MWWETDTYDDDNIIPREFSDFMGPHGIPTVRVFGNGKTDPGWGILPGKNGMNFMDNYTAGKFDPQIAAIGMISGRWDFAFVMRGLALVCIDIDGKNGGFASVGKLGLLPETLAEVSKSKNGYHLFYYTDHDAWDDDKGFALYKDRVGLYPGIDIRAVGCVYHYSGQRWNDRRIAKLPDYLHEKWTEVPSQKYQAAEMERILTDADPDELLIVQTDLERDLNKPIPPGRRNNTLFAIGTKMKLVQVDDWELKVHDRALGVGLDAAEATKIVSNIKRYGVLEDSP